jgi:hypothetical protein
MDSLAAGPPKSCWDCDVPERPYPERAHRDAKEDRASLKWFRPAAKTSRNGKQRTAKAVGRDRRAGHILARSTPRTRSSKLCIGRDASLHVRRLKDGTPSTHRPRVAGAAPPSARILEVTVRLRVGTRCTAVQLGRRIMQFHQSQRIQPRYGRTITTNRGKLYRWCFFDLLIARAFIEQFGGELYTYGIK